MATEAAWLNGKQTHGKRMQKCALTSTGLLMEGASRGWPNSSFTADKDFADSV
jgi:hypothetical protein